MFGAHRTIDMQRAYPADGDGLLRAIFAIAVGKHGLATITGTLGDWKKVDEKELQKAAGRMA